jgi:hypothetical protein
MARTKRALPEYRYFRRPKHRNEEAQLRQLLNDNVDEEFTALSKVNRIRKRLVALPNAWDDIHPSCLWDKYATK